MKRWNGGAEVGFVLAERAHADGARSMRAIEPTPAPPFDDLLKKGEEAMGARMNIGVVTFPGSNCDHDCQHVLADVLGQTVQMVWHKETSLKGLDAVILPGGFSYGDYLRTGAIARFSPVMGAVKEFASTGGMVLGICNGFQILLEAGLLPGAMLRNRSLSFICKDVYVRVENAATSFTGRCEPAQVLKIPIAHADGNYYTDDVTLSQLKATAQIVFRYCTTGWRGDTGCQSKRLDREYRRHRQHQR